MLWRSPPKHMIVCQETSKLSWTFKVPIFLVLDFRHNGSFWVPWFKVLQRRRVGIIRLRCHRNSRWSCFGQSTYISASQMHCYQMTLFCFCYTWWNIWWNRWVWHFRLRGKSFRSKVDISGSALPTHTLQYRSTLLNTWLKNHLFFSFKIMFGDKLLLFRGKLIPEFPASPALLRSVQWFNTFSDF